MKNAFDGLSNSLDTAEERINDLEMSVGTYETMQNIKKLNSVVLKTVHIQIHGN